MTEDEDLDLDLEQWVIGEIDYAVLAGQKVWEDLACSITPELFQRPDRLSALRSLAEGIRQSASSFRADGTSQSLVDAFWDCIGTSPSKYRGRRRRVLAFLTAQGMSADKLAEYEASLEEDRTAEPYQILRPLLFLGFADDFVFLAEEMTDRCMELHYQAIVDDLPERLHRYLASPARLFIHGFDSEALGYCRVALEAAIGSTITDDMVRKLPKYSMVPVATLAQRIDVAALNGYLTPAGRDAADWIRHNGNYALHPSPKPQGGRQAALKALTLLRRVVAELYRSP